MTPRQPDNQDLYNEIYELRKELASRTEQLEDKVDKTYLRIQVFEAIVDPLKKFVYGLIALAGAALITAIMGVVLK